MKMTLKTNAKAMSILSDLWSGETYQSRIYEYREWTTLSATSSIYIERSKNDAHREEARCWTLDNGWSK